VAKKKQKGDLGSKKARERKGSAPAGTRGIRASPSCRVPLTFRLQHLSPSVDASTLCQSLFLHRVGSWRSGVGERSRLRGYLYSVIMLVRSAGRRHRRHTSRILSASFAQLQLPWLAPAQLRWSASHASSPLKSPPRQRLPAVSQSQAAPTQHRSLATAADQYQPLSATPYPPPNCASGFKNDADRNLPWDIQQMSPAARQHIDPTTLTTVRPYKDPIILNTTLQQPAHLIKVQAGLYGTAMDLLQHLHTSLRIGRLDRAEAIIRRLGAHASPDSPELLHAHTAYLEELLRRLASQAGTAEAPKTFVMMRKWFESEVRKKGVQPTAKMLVVMTRAAVRGLQGATRDRTIRRYADWAEVLGPSVHEEVVASEDYDENEFTIIGRVTSAYYELPTEAQLSEPAQAQPQIEEPALVETGKSPSDGDSTSFPEVRSTAQKGTSLENVKHAMRVFAELPPLPKDAAEEAQRKRAYQRQEKMEKTAVEIAIEKWRKEDDDLRKLGIVTALQTRPLGALMWQWYQALVPALEKELAEARASRADDERCHYGPYMELLPVPKMAANAILQMMSHIVSGKNHETKQYENEAKLGSLCVQMGKLLEAEAGAEAALRKSQGEDHANTKAARRARKALLQKVKRKGPSELSQDEKAKLSEVDILSQLKWPLATRAKFGAMLVQKVIETAHLPVTREHPRTKEKVTQMQPAFLHRVKYVNGKKVGYVTPNPALVDKLQSGPAGSLIAKQMPMVVEPKPWQGWNKGGYLHHRIPIMRLGPNDSGGKEYLLAADRKGDMGQIYAGLTALSKVAWKVHPGVLKVQIEAWNTGEAIANFAPLHPRFEMPPEPEASSDPQPRKEYLYRLREIENRRSGLHSKRCFQNFQLEIARSLVNEPLYFPHNMDFRGRAYPIPPYLNHMGADNVRGLLVFSEAKPLGETGLRWLKIHTATVAGYDKASMEERIRFTEEHLEDIYDSVRNPLGGRRWWLQAEDAWQTLAACFELTAALDSPDPTKFLSSLPIQQDGTCNGLQHYAALGGDEIGARQVNLEPGDRPADVYTAVAEAVKEEVRKDAEAGHAIAQKLHGRITRKCVKQPVMTNVYGVTYYGAREQVHRQLEALFPETELRPFLREMAAYITIKIFGSLGTMFRGAQAIQTWLGQCADRIATCLTPEQIKQLTSDETYQAQNPVSRRHGGIGVKKAKKANETVVLSTGTEAADKQFMASTQPLFRSTVIWTTPLRMPVVQPYRKNGTKEIKTNLQTFSLREPSTWDPVSKKKQLQGFPPNFIHSLDATHMMLSALKCSERGLTFASIHDSFWTHACDVNTLSTVLRDAFVEMHSEDIIGRLREEFETRYKGCMYLRSVNALSKVGKRVAELRKTLKAAAIGRSSELALEVERLRLLNSEDPAEREKGEAMVTPGSLVEAEQDESAFAAPSELAGQKLGDLPENAVEATNTSADTLNSDTAERAAAVDDAGDVDIDAAEDAAAASGEEAGPGSATAGPTAKKKRAKAPARKLAVWLPIKFPEVPAKGAFDVRKLKESRYFFH
jgi:DNA-directed RNA polymerase, mitochondrial